MGFVYLASLFTNRKEHWKPESRRLASEVYRDGTFELVPIQANQGKRHPEDRTYADIPSWRDSKKSLAKLLRFDSERAGIIAHDDPSLHRDIGYGYGDVYGPKSSRLFDAQKGDWLLIVSNLAYADEHGRPEYGHKRSGWHLVGCIAIEHVDFAGNGKHHSKAVNWHQHWRDSNKWGYDKAKGLISVIVAGDPKLHDQRFEKAVPLLTGADVASLLRDKHDKPIDVNEKNAAGKRKFPSVMSCLASYTRAIRPIADTEDKADASYLTRLRKAIIELNPGAKKVLW